MSVDRDCAPLPDAREPEALMRLSDQELELVSTRLGEVEHALRAEMAPLQARATELQRQQSLVATERRRRERQHQLAQRREVRSQVQEGAAPSLQELAGATDQPEFGDLDFADLEFLLETGGAIALGYPGSRTPALQMTDGGTVAAVTNLGEVRRLYQNGWEFGVPARRGVRVHTPGTRLERLLEPEKCFVRPRRTAGPPLAPGPAGSG